jgi:hypothetical protein
MVPHRDRGLLSALRGASARRFALAGAGILAALAGCRGILGIHDEPAVQCLTNADCLSGEICRQSDYTCVLLDGSAGDGGDSAVDADGAPSDADATLADTSLPEGGPESASDVAKEPDVSVLIDGKGALDTGADVTVPLSDATQSIDAADATNGADAHDAAAADSSTDVGNAEDTGVAGDASCSVSSAGTCAQCPGSCSIRRPGFLPDQGGNFTYLDAHAFIAVQITVPSPAWLLRLGIETSVNNAVGELALYEDSSGQPGAFVTKVDVTTLADPQTDGSEESVDCNALCIRLTQGTYWVGAVFESIISVLADNGTTATIYQSDDPYPDGGTLADGVVPPGTITTGADDRNIYMVVTAP